MHEHADNPATGLGRYEYTRTLSASRWAWEFLRRNESFLEEAARHGPDEISVRPACHNITLIRPRTEQMAAERWGLAFFPDPRKNGYEADTFWSATLFPRQVKVQVSPAGGMTPCEIYQKTVEQCRITHLVDAAGREHMLVKGNGHVVQVRCSGMSMLSPEPVRLGFLIRDAGNLNARLQALQAAQSVYGSVCLPWTRSSLALRNALIAVDCHAAGLSIRDTAVIIYGKQRADEAWASVGRSMKDEIRRARNKGLALVDGGYRDLLGFPAADAQIRAA